MKTSRSLKMRKMSQKKNIRTVILKVKSLVKSGKLKMRDTKKLNTFCMKRKENKNILGLKEKPNWNFLLKNYTEKDVEHVEPFEEIVHPEEKLAEISEKGFLKLNKDKIQPREELSKDCDKQALYSKECNTEYESEIGSKAVTEEDLSSVKEMEPYNLEEEEDNKEQRLCEEDEKKSNLRLKNSCKY
ncbi:uncharacterized protein LOC143233069 isoform X1 [Tachypleus tridentatus]|uniref:uncharacterized protein LOC143233069 isoform X1 n=1 Tax=Tachypleus tridentatus TaxID=6853 RepID=UPI003FD213A5